MNNVLESAAYKEYNTYVRIRLHFNNVLKIR